MSPQSQNTGPQWRRLHNGDHAEADGTADAPTPDPRRTDRSLWAFETTRDTTATAPARADAEPEAPGSAHAAPEPQPEPESANAGAPHDAPLAPESGAGEPEAAPAQPETPESSASPAPAAPPSSSAHQSGQAAVHPARTRTRRAGAHAAVKKKWRLNKFSLIPAALAIVGVLALSYPTVASWLTQYNQSKVVTGYEQQVDNAQPEKAVQLQKAKEYNDALSVGALLQANTNVPTGAGSSADETLDYNQILTANASGLMGRIKIPSIDVDLPIYHGTSDQTLLEGIGHLEGTSLPVGGDSTRTVLTGHRGLADAKMFTDLDKVDMGDTFTLEIFGEVLTYQVSDKKVVEPEETETLRVERGRDLATLVTCTPLGINTHRILLTGERITPTPIKDIEDAGKEPTVPHFPWWALWIPASFVLVGLYIWWAGLPVAPKKKRDTKGAEGARADGAPGVERGGRTGEAR